MELEVQEAGRAPYKAAIEILNADQFQYYWPQIEACLDADPDNSWSFVATKDSIIHDVLAGQCLVWVAVLEEQIRMVIFTNVLVSPRGKDLMIWWAYGRDLDKLLSVIDLGVDQVARALGCSRIIVTGRRGWSKKLRPLRAQFLSSTWWRPVEALKEN